MGSSIKKNYIYNVSFQIFSLLIPFITTPYISRVLQAEGTGTYSFANSIATIFSLFAALGLSSYGVREVSRVRDSKRRASQLYWELTIIRVISTLVNFFVFLVVVHFTDGDMKIYLATSLTILAVGVDCTWFFQAMEQFRVLMMRNFIIKIISITCIFLFVKEKSDLVLYILIQTGSIFLSNVALLPQLRKHLVRVPFHRLRFKKHIRETIVYFIPTIATSVYTVLDKAMIGFFYMDDRSQNGFYELAHKIVNMLMTVITSLNVVVGVRTSYLFGQNREDEIKEHIRDTFRFMFMVSFPLCMGLTACADTFVPWFYGPGFEPIAPMLKMFAPLLFIIGISNVLGSLYLTPSGQRARSNRAVIIGAATNFALNLLLIRPLGAYGAVIASVSAEVVISTLYVSYSKDFISSAYILRTALRYALLAGVMFVPTYLLGKVLPANVTTTFLQVGTGVVVYVLCLIISHDPSWLALKNILRKKLKKNDT